MCPELPPGLIIGGLQISRLQVLLFGHHDGHQTNGAAHHHSWNGPSASRHPTLMHTGDAKTMLQIIVGTRQVWDIIAMKQTGSKVPGDFHKVINSCAQPAQTGFLLLHVLNPGQIRLSNLGSRLLLMIGQDMSGLIYQRISVLEGGPQYCGALQRFRDDLLQVLQSWGKTFFVRLGQWSR